jgi:hypothetical protein
MNPAARGKRILSISYDEPLLVTREMMLEQAGFTVTSALGFTEAIEKCNSGFLTTIITKSSTTDTSAST